MRFSKVLLLSTALTFSFFNVSTSFAAAPDIPACEVSASARRPMPASLKVHLDHLEEVHPDFFAGYRGTNFEFLEGLRGAKSSDIVPGIGAELRKMTVFLKQQIGGVHGEECHLLSDEIEDTLQSPNKTTLGQASYLGYRLAMIGAEFSLDEEVFFKGAGFSELYDALKFKGQTRDALAAYVANAIDEKLEEKEGDFSHPYYRYFEGGKEVDQICERGPFAEAEFLLPGYDVLGFFYLAHTYLKGLHPIPVASNPEPVELHGLSMSRWAQFCHDSAHANADVTDFNPIKFSYNLLHRYLHLFEGACYGYDVSDVTKGWSTPEDGKLHPLSLHQKREYQLSNMLPRFTEFAVSVHSAFRQSLVEVLERSAEEIGPNQPLTDAQKAYWASAFYYAHEAAPDMSAHYGSGDLGDLLRKSIEDVSVKVDLFKTSYLTGESPLSDEEIFEIVKVLPESKFIGVHFSTDPLSEELIVDYKVERTPLFVEVVISTTRGEKKIYREQTNLSRQLNFKHDLTILGQAEPILCRKGYTLPVIPEHGDFGVEEEAYNAATDECAKSLEEGLKLLKAHYVEETIARAQEVGESGVSIEGRFIAAYTAAWDELRASLPLFIPDLETFIDEATSPANLAETYADGAEGDEEGALAEGGS